MFNANSSALLIIDMQWGFINSSSSLCVAGAASTIGACAKTLEIARNLGIAVFHVRREYAFDGSDVEPVRKSVWLEGGKPLCAQGDDPKSIEAPDSLKEILGESVIIKPRFSAFFGTDLDETLRRMGIGTLILTGTTTPNCIRTTCYDALSLNYDVIIVEDATSSRSLEVQAANIEDMAYIGAKITETSELGNLFC